MAIDSLFRLRLRQFRRLRFHVIRMNSVWLCCDAEPSRLLQRRRSTGTISQTAPVLGVFTDDPAIIARRMGRPRTPFVPSPPPAVDFREKWASSDDASESICDSPTAAFGGAFDSPRVTTACGISIF
jgi:hypothetical protein